MKQKELQRQNFSFLALTAILQFQLNSFAKSIALLFPNFTTGQVNGELLPLLLDN